MSDRRRLGGPEGCLEPLIPARNPQLPLIDPETYQRGDGRYPEQMRPIQIQPAILDRPDGSAFIQIGSRLRLTCAVYGPRMASGSLKGAAAGPSMTSRGGVYREYGSLTCHVDLLPACLSHRQGYQTSLLESEISSLIAMSLVPAVRRETFPNAFVDIYINVIEADDGLGAANPTIENHIMDASKDNVLMNPHLPNQEGLLASISVAGVLAATTALSEARVEMYDTVVASSVALTRSGAVVVDPSGWESLLCSDLSGIFYLAWMPNRNLISQCRLISKSNIDSVPMDSLLLQECLNTGMETCRTVYQESIVPILP